MSGFCEYGIIELECEKWGIKKGYCIKKIFGVKEEENGNMYN